MKKGQILLITLLVLSVAMTIALALLARTTTDISISNQIEESSRAFSAAEAGIEEALKTGTSNSVVLSPGVTYNVTVATVGGAAGVYTFPRTTLRDNTESLWLVEHNPDGSLNETLTYMNPTIDLCWSTQTTAPALVATILYKRGSAYAIAKGAWDPDAVRRSTNQFSQPTAAAGGCGSASMYRQLVTFSDFGINPASDILLAIRLRPTYNNTQIAVNAAGVLPLQGNRIESTGTTTTGVTRRVIVYQQYRSPGTIFDAVIYSQSSFGH